MKIYVASSWRNARQPRVVKEIRELGHEVYDFRNPSDGDCGFHWSHIDPNWESWSPYEYIKALSHPLAQGGFNSDFDAMKWADTFVLVQPCGRSAHLELGWAVGAGKVTIMLLDADNRVEPELMAKMCDYLCEDMVTMRTALKLVEDYQQHKGEHDDEDPRTH